MERWQAARTVICLRDSVLTPVRVPSFLSTLNPNFQPPAPVRLQKPWGQLLGLCELPSGATATGWGRMQSTGLSGARTQPFTEVLPLPLTCSLATCGGPQTGKALWAPFIFSGRGAKLPPFAGESEFQKEAAAHPVSGSVAILRPPNSPLCIPSIPSRLFCTLLGS